MKKLGFVLICIVAVFITFVVGKNSFAKALLTQGLTKAAHVPVNVGSVSVGLKSAQIDIKNLRINNPRQFPEKLMLHAPEIAIDFDLKAFWKGKTHFQEVRLTLAELVVIRNKDGQLNVDALRPKESQAPDQAKTPGKMPKFMIDRLILTVGKVVYKDYSMGENPVVQEFNIGIQNREYRNIDNPQSLVSLIMFETLTRTTLGHLANLDLSAFQQDASGILSKGLGILGASSGQVEKVAEDLLGIFK